MLHLSLILVSILSFTKVCTYRGRLAHIDSGDSPFELEMPPTAEGCMDESHLPVSGWTEHEKRPWTRQTWEC